MRLYVSTVGAGSFFCWSIRKSDDEDANEARVSPFSAVSCSFVHLQAFQRSFADYSSDLVYCGSVSISKSVLGGVAVSARVQDL